MEPATADGLVDVAILDDDPDFRTYLEDTLRDEGQYSVRTFGHPTDLFEGMEQRVPDIVLLDMKMGEFRGERVLEQLLSKQPGLCVIIVTGYPSLEDMRATFQMKVFDYVAKPFSLAQLRQTLENAVEKFGFGKSLQDRLRATGDFEAARKAFVARQPMARLGTPEEIADLAVHLAGATYTSGQAYAIDGGWTI